MPKNDLFTLASLLALCAACSGSPAEEQGVPSRTPSGKEDAWDPYVDDPSIFAGDLLYEVDALPQRGEVDVIPWAGSYWPIARDGINYPWAGPTSEPATTKYGRAFGVAGVEDAVSRLRGVESYAANPECVRDDECDASRGEICGIRAGEESGYCIPSWEGICNGWTPASILEAEPRVPVTWGDTTFQVNDIKALASLAYYRTQGVTIGSRCMTDGNSPWMTYDEHGRPFHICRDTNAGTWHVVATNFLGLRGRSFAYDRTWDVEVWNQPLRGYEITRQEEVSAADANAIIGVTYGGGEVETFAESVIQGQWMHFGPFTAEAASTFRARITGDADADLYLRVGEHPTASDYDCRPYLEGSVETCEVEVSATEDASVYVSVRGYAPTSRFSLTVTRNMRASESYLFNEEAARFFHVEMDVEYIAESDARTDGPLADRIDEFTKTDHYEYILEVDAEGRIIGGEWAGESKRLHPDFLWLPDRPSEWRVANRTIHFGQVKALLNLSAYAPEGTPVVDVRDVEVPREEWVNLGPFSVGAGKLVVYTQGDGEVDLFVRRGAVPTAEEHDCYPRADPTALSLGSNELCVLDGQGEYYVSLWGWAELSKVRVELSYVE